MHMICWCKIDYPSPHEMSLNPWNVLPGISNRIFSFSIPAGFGVNPGSFGIGGVQPSLGGGGTSLFGSECKRICTLFMLYFLHASLSFLLLQLGAQDSAQFSNQLPLNPVLLVLLHLAVLVLLAPASPNLVRSSLHEFSFRCSAV